LDEHWGVPFGIAERGHSTGRRIGAMIAAPNPFRGSVTIELASGDWSTDERVEIFNVSGRRVKRVSPGSETGYILWDGLDESGRSVPGGVYFARAGADRNALKLLKVD